MSNDELSQDERALLAWLGQDETSQYGECCGPALDSLVGKGLVEIMGADTETHNTFIAKGRGIMYRAVRLTDLGYTVLDAQER